MDPGRRRSSAAGPAPLEPFTPMFQQWREAKRRHPDALLFFRMGDFYELFFEDAEVAAPILGIALTVRGRGTATTAPMCGVPHHAVGGYVARLVERGLRVALCEQVEDPRQARGMVRREVVRVVSPGALVDPQLLDPALGNFLAAVSGRAPGPFGVAVADVSTGELVIACAENEAALAEILVRHGVREILAPEAAAAELKPILPQVNGVTLPVTPVLDDAFAPARARQRVLELLGVSSLAAFGCPDEHPALPAVAAALGHLTETQRAPLAHLDRLRVEQADQVLVLDQTTRRNLELVANLRDGTRQRTLLEALDRTRTPMGARRLRGWLLEPLRVLSPLLERLALVDELVQRADRRRAIRDALGRVRDLERLVGRAALGLATPVEALTLLRSLEATPPVVAELANLATPGAERLARALDALEDLAETLRRTLADPPAGDIGEGRVVRPGCDAALDEARELAQGGRTRIAELEARERERTGISALKVRYNRVFGYFIEVRRASVHRVPADWERRQTIANGERFVTPELRELESRILSAEEQLGARERELFKALLGEVAARAGRVRSTAAALAEIDATASLAEVAAQEGYVRPHVDESDRIEIEEGRHPVVERLLPAGRFVPNGCRLDDDQRLLIVTGPNMGGKSTFLRQTALIVLMAQAGAFVPARAARIGLCDRIFCRVGASDNLAGGESTFMVEMTETANILHNATPRSLVLLDEIGRGTATWDGMAIAWAVVEALHDDPRLAPKALFATHYHELTELAASLLRLANVHIAVREHGHDVVFLHRVEPGPTDRSYGIHVARLAGLPDRVVHRAREILERLVRDYAGAARAAQPGAAQQLLLFESQGPTPVEADVLGQLRASDPDALSPRQAHDLLRRLWERLDRGA